MLRLALSDWGYRLLDVAPAQVKKFASGKGNISKPRMALAVYKRWGREFPDHNQTDAYVLAQIARLDGDPVARGVAPGFQRKIVESLARE